MDDTAKPRRYSTRTRQRLAFGGLAAAASIALTGCEDAPPTFQNAEFTTVAECTRAGFPEDLCKASYNSAYMEHARTAQQFKTAAECEKEWGSGHCAPQIAGSGPNTAPVPGLAGVPASTGSSVGSVFVPALAGFMVSQALQQRYYDRGGVDIDYYGGYYGGYRGTPIYRTRTGSTVTVDRSSGKAISTPVNVNTRTVAQSGFGGRSFSRSYSGGSSGRSFGG